MSTKPNILFITSDQHRGDALGSANHPCVRTPHLDKLSQMGIRYERAYSDCPVCIPARTTMVTGIQSHVYGMPNYQEDYRIDRERAKFLGSLMTQAGYQTEIIGKAQHWHTERTFRGGFEHILNEQNYHDDVQFHTQNYRSDQSGIGANELFPDRSHLPPELHMTQWIVDRCVKFLKYRDRTQPFFLWASFVDPHPPNTIHEPYYSMYDDEDIPEAIIPDWIATDECPYELLEHRSIWNSVRMKPKELRKARGVYYGKITNIDHQLGRLLGKLRAEDTDNTLIIYTSDHGEMLGDLNDMGKSTFLEPSTHVPFILCPPKSMNIEPGQVSNALIGLDDLLPTFCDFAGIQAPTDITGKSMLPLIRGEEERIHEDYHGQIGNSHMFHDGNYKYLYFADDGKELLFDSSVDRRDEHNLAGEEGHQDILNRIREKFIAHLTSEDHAHVQAGQLVNLKKPQEKINQLQARNYYGWH